MVFQGLTIQKLHRDERPAILLVNLVDGANVRMVQGRRGSRFPLEAAQCPRVSSYVIRKELQCDESIEFEILGLVDDTHPAATEFFHDVVMRDSFADHRARSSSAVMLEVLRLLVNDPEERKMV